MRFQEKAERASVIHSLRRRAVALLTLCLGTAAMALAPARAQDKSGPVRQVRVIEAAKRGFSTPAGIAYSPRADALVVFGAAPQRGLPGSELRLITMGEDPRGSVRLAMAITDPRNMAFDAKASRLLLLDARQGELIAIPARGDGNLDPARQVRFAADHFSLVNPRGLTVDPVSGRLFVLDKGGPWLLRIEPDDRGGFDTATVSRVDLGHLSLTDPRGLAYDATTGHLHVLSGAKWLYELTEEAELVATRELSGLGLFDPRAMVFAPSGDTTDDPGSVSVYIADGGRRAPRPSAKALVEGAARQTGGIVELSLTATPPTVEAPTFQSSVVRTTLTSQWSPPAPDTSDVVYLPATNTLRVVDSEVEEMNIWAGVSEWETDLFGNVIGTSDLTPPTGFTNEPTGLSVNPTNRHLFYSDDGGKRIYEIDPGPDLLYHTTDDIRTFFSTSAFGSSDPEDVTYHPGEGVIYLVDGVNREVYRIAPGPNGIFNGIPPAGDDVVTHYDVSAIVTDPEGLTVNTDSGNLYIAGKPDTIVQEITTSGALVQTVDISAANAKKTAGLGFGPGSGDPTARRLYVVQRGIDNNSDPNENDGKLWEMTLPGGGPPGNQPPVVDAGPDQTITQPNSASLDGTVSDDGLPTPPGVVTTNWTQVSGPGTATFGDASAVDTTASFDVGGVYVLRLTADDSALISSDEITVTVSTPGQLSVTKKGAIHVTTNASAYSFGSITASNDRLYVVFVSTSVASGGTAPSATSVSGAGLTFTEIGTPGGLLYSGTLRRIQGWRALVASGATTGSIAISLGAASTGMDAVLLEFDGVDTSGTNGSGAVVQSATNQATSASALTVTLSAFANASNRPVAFFNHRVAEATTAESSYTELDDGSHRSPPAGAQCEWHATAAETTPSASWPTTANVGGFALEIRSGGSGPPVNQPPVVSAGSDQTITFPNSVSLDGTVSDDGLPNPPGMVTNTWSQVSGTGTATFGDPSAVDTTASFDVAGTYQLRLTAEDSDLISSDDIMVTVNTPGQLSVSNKGAIHVTTDASAYSFASITASNNRLYVVFLSTSTASGGTAPAATSVSGAGLSFTEIGTPGGLLYSASPGVRRMQGWRALVGSGAATGSIAISLGGTSTGMDAVLLEFSGVDTSGTNGSGAVVQSATNQATGATALTVTLSAFGNSSNRPVAFFNHRVAEATTQESGYTELDDGSHSAPPAGAECEWHASAADTTPSASWPTSGAVGGFAIEVKAGP